MKYLQELLFKLGYKDGINNGKFDSKTLNAVQAFQKDNNLPITGKVGKEFWDLIEN